MVYAQLYNLKLDGSVDEKLGSDGVQHIDGRLSLNNMINKIHQRIQKDSFLNDVVSFQIRKGERYTTSHPISSMIEVKK